MLTFGACYLEFLLHLSVHHGNRFAVAGAISVGGALLMEMPLGYWANLAGRHDFIYGMIDLVEKSLKMIGASMFVLALLRFLAEHAGEFQVSIGKTQTASGG